MCNCDKLLAAIDRYIAKADDDLTEQLRLEGYEAPAETVKLISEIEDEVAEALVAETDHYVRAAAEYSKNDPRGALDLKEFFGRGWTSSHKKDKLAGALYSIFGKKLTKYMPQYIQYYLQKSDKGLKFVKMTERTTDWINGWSRELGRNAQLTSVKQIEGILTEGIELGKGIDWFVKRIRDDGIHSEYYRARRMALTEVLRLHSVAQDEARMQSPAVTDKMWSHTGNYRNVPRDNHVDMDGQIVPKNKPFKLIGRDGETYEPQYPRDVILPPEESVNCHCLAQNIVSDKILGLSLEERQRLQAEAIAEMDKKWEDELDRKNRERSLIDIQRSSL